jgi:DMSO/TMAO reductase YedYZ molybdopterin-dependent catalytic subunit
MDNASPSWLNAHSHDPNPVAPPGEGEFTLAFSGIEVHITLAGLRQLPFTEVADCYIVSTGHGRSGPFRFGGVCLADFLAAHLEDSARVAFVDFISADGYGTRLEGALLASSPQPLLAWQVDGAPMRRAQGLVRLVVPGEADDALHQVKWLARVEVCLTCPG